MLKDQLERPVFSSLHLRLRIESSPPRYTSKKGGNIQLDPICMLEGTLRCMAVRHVSARGTQQHQQREGSAWKPRSKDSMESIPSDQTRIGYLSAAALAKQYRVKVATNLDDVCDLDMIIR